MAAGLAVPASAQVHVRGHIRNDGTYVQPHWRSKPNNTTQDNWSSKPNYNPYTGQQGTENAVPNPYQPRNLPRYQNSPLPPSTQERWRETMPLTCKYSDLC
jgi:hypothetical protein